MNKTFPLAVPLSLSLVFPAAMFVGAIGWANERSHIDHFEKHVRPLLVEHCYECHSGQTDDPAGGLRLDSRDATRNGGESGPAVVPGKPDESLLLSAIRHESFEMPPDVHLSPRAIDEVERWIADGAVDPRETADVVEQRESINAGEHWAFQPLGTPVPPATRHVGRTETAIDRFVVARLEEAGLSLAPPADRRTLIRRVTFDLLGLPPTPEEVARFVDDRSPGAWERLIERLLASPAYGERWGRHWLDVARYADNKGYVFFEEKTFPWAWTYRDYVVNSLNADLPYDRFVREQIAADQLAPNDPQTQAALGFLTLGPRFINNAHDIIDDRIDVVTRGVMGLTVSCARCHDHKFDPVSQADYYGLYGVFRSSVDPLLGPALASPSAAFANGLQQRVEALEHFVQQQRAKIVDGARQRVDEYLMAVHARRNQPGTESFMLITDTDGLNPRVIGRWESYLRRTRRAEDPIWTVWHAYAALSDERFSAEVAGVHRTLFGPNASVPIHPLVRETFEDLVPAAMSEIAAGYAQLLLRIDAKWRARTGTTATRLDDDAEEQIRHVFYGSESPPMIPRTLSYGFLDLIPDRATQDELKKLIKEVETWSVRPEGPPRAMVLRDADQPYQPVIFVRGNPHQQGAAVPRRFPAFLSGEETGKFVSGSGRRELAERVTDPTNPLTARVIVNRLWQHHFGRGLVETPSDFGLQSTPPSHPLLLDWLASEFIRHDWSMKWLHRVLLRSAVYQQASHVADQENAVRIDPTNRLLWHFRRRRLGYEAMRDSLLATSGQLDLKIGGPPVHHLKGFVPRRTLYGFVDRMNLPGVMRTFDFPEPVATSGGRERTTIAPQALFFLNDSTVAECATRITQRPGVRDAQGVEQQIIQLYQLVLGRLPDRDERNLGLAYLTAGAAGDSTAAADANRLVQYAQALLMSNEFLFVD